MRRERWTWRRGAVVATALVSFYASYFAYRNLKSVVPLLRPNELFDRQLADWDRVLFGGNDPAALLHTLLGTGFANHALSGAYLLLFIFIPVTLAAALVFSPNLQAGLFYASAQSLNWLLGAASYFLLPSLGPIYTDPGVFANLPVTDASKLQVLLLDQRIAFLARPGGRDRAEHRRVRLAPRLDLLHGRARGAHPRPRPRGGRSPRGRWSR